MLKRTQSDTSKTPQDLGTSLRQRRKAQGLTMQTVADRAGLSVGFISQVERNLTAPSLSSLASLSEALGAHISDFLVQPSTTEEISSAVGRSRYSLPGAAHSYERLSSAFPGSQLHTVLLHEPPGHRSEPISHKGEELHFVIEGELTVEIEGERFVLEKGDSIHFDSRRTHSTWNHGADPATILVCATLDLFGDDPASPTGITEQDRPTQQEGKKDES